MNTLKYILDKYSIGENERAPHNLSIGRWRDLPKLFAELGFTHGAEIGIEQGKYSERLCSLIPNLKLHAIDAWQAYDGYRDHVSQSKIDGFYRDTVKRLEPYDVNIIRDFSMNAVSQFDDKSLDFVYIDANHEFVQVAQDIKAWSKKVRKGGIVAGHDFCRDKNRNYVNHVKDVVQAWTYSHGIKHWFVAKNNKSPSWFWVVT